MAIGAENGKFAMASYGESDHITLNLIDTNQLVSVASDRKEWKQFLIQGGWMKVLADANIVAKEGGGFSPNELFNECDYVFAHDQNGNLHELRMA
jgi:hypothetical protein